MGYGNNSNKLKLEKDFNIVDKIEENFFNIINERTSWGKNQIAQAYKDAKIKAMQAQIEHNNRNQAKQFATPDKINVDAVSNTTDLPEKRVFKSTDTLTFGKYRGSVVEEIIFTDPNYLRWCLENVEWFDLEESVLDRI